MTEQVLGLIVWMLGDPDDRYAGRLSWHHCRDSRHCAGSPGLPDLFICGPGGACWAEVKPAPSSTLRPAQVTWRHRLLAAGQRHVIWTERELRSGEVRRVLDGLVGRRIT